jgi:chromosome segregation ATPase
VSPQEATLIEKERAMSALKESRSLAIELDGLRQKSAEDARDFDKMRSQIDLLKAKIERQAQEFESQRGQIRMTAEHRAIELEQKLLEVMEAKKGLSKEMKKIERERDRALETIESQKQLDGAVRSSLHEIQGQQQQVAQVICAPQSHLSHHPRHPLSISN